MVLVRAAYPSLLPKLILKTCVTSTFWCFVHHIMDKEAAFSVAVIVVNAVQFYTRNCTVYKWFCHGKKQQQINTCSVTRQISKHTGRVTSRQANKWYWCEFIVNSFLYIYIFLYIYREREFGYAVHTDFLLLWISYSAIPFRDVAISIIVRNCLRCDLLVFPVQQTQMYWALKSSFFFSLSIV